MTSWSAPPASHAPQVWTPDDTDPGDRRDGLTVTGWLRSVVPPRRGGLRTAIRPVPGVDEAWAGLRHAVWAQDRAIRDRSGEASRVWELVTADTAGARDLGARLLAPEARIGSEAEDLALIRVVRERFQYIDESIDDRLADFLVAGHGLPEACRRVVAGFHMDLPYVAAGVFGRLRELLVAAGDDTYERCRDVLLETRDRTAGQLSGNTLADLFWAVSYVLPVGPRSGAAERDAHGAAMRHVGEFGNFNVHATGLASGGLDTLDRFLHANRKVRHEFFGATGPRIYLAGMLDIAGAEVGPVLSRMRPSYPFEDDAYYNGLWCSLLAHVDHDDARAALAAQQEAGHVWATGFTPVREQEHPGVPDGTPCAYQPPEAARPAWLDVTVPVEPVLRFRDEEREAAEQAGVYADAVQWDGVPISRCDTAAVTAWLEHREHFAIPTPLPALALAPAWTHERLMALGFSNFHYWVSRLAPMLLLRHGTSHVAPLLAAFEDRRSAEAALEAAQPVGHPSLAVPVVRAFAARKQRRRARSWLLRHPDHAAAGTVALWTADPSDDPTGRVLRYLDTQGHRALLLTQAGDRAAELTAFLDRDPLDAPRAKKPKVPAYLTAQPLPPLITASGGEATPDDQDHFLVRLASCNTDEVHPAVLAARDRWTASSRAAFADALFDRWVAAGAPATEGWCMQAVGLIGDDTGARRIASHARQWAGTPAAARAQAALDALRHRGTDAALIELSLLAERSRFPVFRSVAKGHIEAIADLRGLTSDELADRLVPLLGLDDEGGDTVEVDAGTFRIAFDERLMPVLRDATGRILADLPKPARGADRVRQKAAKDRLTALRKEARSSASLHVARLERAMCARRRIPAAIFLDRFAGHPWMTHLAQRLIWGVHDVSGALLTTVRVAEDGTLADVGDEPVILAGDAGVSVPHPLDLPDGVRAGWAGVFADYQLLQPFAQLDRPVYRDVADLDRFVGRKTTYAVLRGLERHGWTRWYSGAVQMAKPLGGGAWAVLGTDPGWHASDTVDSALPQTVDGVTLFRAGDLTLGDLPPVVFSELVHDLRVLD
ncbi:DUF4132 domain-containing protein [Actinoplanes subglobosus]|uniref:DUF4132 domain-containing protein n=1 Tax=Actinoplanes subglobosus TaxID=1547892 RepID=A0ABV8J6X7_9ACTN